MVTSSVEFNTKQKPEKERNWLAASIALGLFLSGQLALFLLSAQWFLQLFYTILFLGILSAGYRYYAYVFIFRVVTPVSVGFFFLLIYKYVYTVPLFSNFLDASFRISFHIERFFEVLAVLYAITTAFLLWKGLSDHDMLKRTLNSEANIIRSINNYTSYFDKDKGNNHHLVKTLEGNFIKYIKNILSSEKIKNNKDNDVILKNNIEIVSKFQLDDKNDEIALAEIMKQLSDLNETRSHRQSYMDSAMSPYLLFALFVMSISILYPFFTKSPTEGGSAAYTMIFIMSTLLTFMFITMLDISRPFAGFWRIKTDLFSNILKEMQNDQ